MTTRVMPHVAQPPTRHVFLSLALCACTIALLMTTTTAAAADDNALMAPNRCATTKCLISAYTDRVNSGTPSPVLPVAADIGDCTSATCPTAGDDTSGVLAGPQQFGLVNATWAGDYPLCCLYNSFVATMAAASQAQWSTAAARAGAIALVTDGVLNNRSLAVGGVSEPLFRFGVDPLPFDDSFAILGLVFTSLTQAQDGRGSSGTTGGNGAASVLLWDRVPVQPRLAALAQLDGTATSLMVQASQTPAFLTANPSSAWSFRLSVPCDPAAGVGPLAKLDLRLVITEVSGGTPYTSTERVSTFCNLTFAVGPVPVGAYSVAISRDDSAALPAGLYVIAQLPMSAHVVYDPTQVHSQDTRVFGNVTVLFLCPAGTVQRSSRLSATFTPDFVIPLAQHAAGGVGLYSLSSAGARRSASYAVGMPPGIPLTQVHLNIDPYHWRGRSSMATLVLYPSAPVAVSSRLLMHGTLMQCTLPVCSTAVDGSIPILYDTVNRLALLLYMTSRQLVDNIGNGCQYRITVPSGTLGVLVNMNFTDRSMARIGGRGLPQHIESGVASWYEDGDDESDEAVPVVAGTSSLEIDVDAGYYTSFLHGYPREWQVPGELAQIDNRQFTLDYSRTAAPTVGGLLQFAQQRRCPTAVALDVQLSDDAGWTWVGVVNDTAWPAGSSCTWVIRCRTPAATPEILGGDKVFIDGFDTAVTSYGLGDAFPGSQRVTLTIRTTTATAYFPNVQFGLSARCALPNPARPITRSESLSESETYTYTESVTVSSSAGHQPPTNGPSPPATPTTPPTPSGPVTAQPSPPGTSTATPAPTGLPPVTVPSSSTGAATTTTTGAATTTTDAPGTPTPTPTTAPDMDCTVIPDPCGPHGTCIVGSGCICDQDAQRGFWTGATCGRCAVGWAGSDCKTECHSMPCPTSVPTTPVPTMATTGAPSHATRTLVIPTAPPFSPTAAPTPPRTQTRELSVTPSRSLTIGIPAQPQSPPSGIGGGAAGDSAGGFATVGGLEVPYFAAAVGGAVLLLAVAAVVLAPRLRRAWRRRRRAGGPVEEPATPMRDRLHTYRWYEDAEAVANDLEQRGDDVQRTDHEGLLVVPGLVERPLLASAAPAPMLAPAPPTMAADGLPDAGFGLDLDRMLAAGATPSFAGATAAPAMNPLTSHQAPGYASSSVLSQPTTVAAAGGGANRNPLHGL